MQHEITEPGPLLDERGRLRRRGFSKRFLLHYNPERLRLTPLRALDRLRLKEWDYYATTTPDYFFSATVAHVGYIGLVFVYFIDFADNRQAEKMIVTPLGAGCSLPRSSEAGDIDFTWGRTKVMFLRAPEQRVLRIVWPRFDGRADLNAELIARQPDDMESIVMCTPMGEQNFYYNHKVNCMPTTGRIKLGDRVLQLSEDRALTSLDWGRGVWPYQTFWNWGSASGFLPDGRRIGLNLGEGFGDLTAATENCFYLDGKMHKLENVPFVYNDGDFMKPWKLVSDDERLTLTFTPFLERVSKVNLAAIAMEGHQMFGRYRGVLIADDGERIALDELIGWAEEHRARW